MGVGRSEIVLMAVAAILLLSAFSFAEQSQPLSTAAITSKPTSAVFVPKETSAKIRKADVDWKDARIGYNNTSRNFTVVISAYAFNNSTGRLYKTGTANNTSVIVVYQGSAADRYNLVVITGPLKTGKTYGSSATLRRGEEAPIAVEPDKNYVVRKWEVLMGECTVKNPYAPSTEVAIFSSDKRTCVVEAQMGSLLDRYTGVATSGAEGKAVSTGTAGGKANAVCTAAKPVCPEGTLLEISSDQFGCPIYNCKKTGAGCPVVKPDCPPGSVLTEAYSPDKASGCAAYECRKLSCPIASSAAPGGVNIWEDCSLYGGVKPPQWIDELGCVHACLETKKTCPTSQPILEDCSVFAGAVPAEPWLDENGCLHKCKGSPLCTAKSQPVLVDCGKITTTVSWLNQKTGCWEACKPPAVCPIDGVIADIDCGTSPGIGIQTKYVDEQGCVHVCKPAAAVCPVKGGIIYDIDCSSTAAAAVVPEYTDKDGCIHKCKKQTVSGCDTKTIIEVDCSMMGRVAAQPWKGEDGCLYKCSSSKSCPTKAVKYVDCAAYGAVMPEKWVGEDGCTYACLAKEKKCPNAQDPTYVDCAASTNLPSYIDENGCTYLCKKTPVCSQKGVRLVDCSAGISGKEGVWVGEDGCAYACKKALVCLSRGLNYVDCPDILPEGFSWTDDSGCKFACRKKALCASAMPVVKTDCPPTSPASYVDAQIGCTVICRNVAEAFVPKNQTNQSKPDLVISQISIPATVTVNVRVYGSITTKNVGQGHAGNSTTAYYINGAFVNSIPVPPLPPGASSTGNASFVCLRAGTYAFSAKADYLGAILEENETNNEKNVTFSCVLSSGQVQTSPVGSESIVASMADTSGNLYAKVMGILGVHLESYR
ncbi:MAG: hypothetical protein N3E51_02255 [Candidatus Micrarchaeota archaeon]|nr:hypothetical protein [Candidatus Micrarchaeota archaeon]